MDTSKPASRGRLHRGWAGGHWETYVLFAADGSVLSQSTNKHVGYPVHWDDDTSEEYYRYRSGVLEDHYEGSALASGLAPAHGSVESVEADIVGDWREELLVASGLALYVCGNDSPGANPTRPTPRALRDYRLNLASVGTGLPKPLPFLVSQLDALPPGTGPWPQ